MNKLESLSVEGDTPVIEIFNGSIGILSRSEHVIFWLNLGGPPSNPKYYLQIDSEQVPWGKGEKYSSEESEIEPETISLQSFGALWFIRVTDCLLHNEPASCGVWQG